MGSILSKPKIPAPEPISEETKKAQRMQLETLQADEKRAEEERMKELSQNLGSAFGRLINETMMPLVTKILFVMEDRGLIDLPLRVNGLEIKVVPVAPLAMAQAMEEVEKAIKIRLSKIKLKFDGDSIDREIVRDIIFKLREPNAETEHKFISLQIFSDDAIDNSEVQKDETR